MTSPKHRTCHPGSRALEAQPQRRGGAHLARRRIIRVGSQRGLSNGPMPPCSSYELEKVRVSTIP